jgi:putative transposase
LIALEDSAMPRTIRASEGGLCYHVLNRGNAQARVFHQSGDYEAFLTAAAEASLRVPMRALAYCLMPNHFHLVVWPVEDGDLSLWMRGLMTTQVRRHLARHRHHAGHVWQGRFKAFPIQEDGHLLAVLRYVERNPLRADLVAKAEDWPWSSLHPDAATRQALKLDPGPVPRPDDWVERVNTAMTEAEEAAVRQSIRRGQPLGSGPWVLETAQRLGLGSTLRPRGRPRKLNEGESNPNHFT